MPSINLLPWRADLRKRRQKEFLIGLAGAAGLAVLIGLLAHFTVSTMIDAQQAKNDLLKSEITKLDKQIEEIIALEEEKARMVARMEVIEKLQKSRPEVVKVFDELVSTLPEGVYLTSVKQSVRRLELNGVAQSSTRVSALHAQHRRCGGSRYPGPEGDRDRRSGQRLEVHPVFDAEDPCGRRGGG